ncbi:DNA primase large subunit [Megachile rotundata]|uniref:DNA primase large subunit n=1 Tax=Megachile rotundata TaxID=143995 RepID=UPI000614C50B|nr:PREDICTED: DNA primase large subunit-like [Megachile rotundata]XP_012154353.1 PREDICTED: DNA primase large subunit-like [Megachile rotundata]XP_012154354.1 PREDICTED: DNA primase large subunit-like [Megachile rotundata]
MADMLTRDEINVKNNQISNNMYLHNLQMYSIPPSGYVKLEELQEWCVNRLKLLKLVKQISVQNYKRSFKHCLNALIKELEGNDLHNFLKLISTPDCQLQETNKQSLRRNDCMSHFLLRAAFSFEHRKRQWFFEQEVNLFKWRCSSLDEENMKTFITTHDLQFPFISEVEKQNIKEDLEISCPDKDIKDVKFYKAHFTKVLSLVKRRQVFLQNGIAYVPETKIWCLILSKFKKILNDGFLYGREMASNAYNDERITNILAALPKCINTTHFKYNKFREVTISELDELSRTSYPLCMRILHEALKTNHHLTNGGRVQYCLFLKGIGLNLGDALKFWKDEFTKKINEVTFNKEYKYHIRHLYGMEGRQANYEPFHCTKIFNSTVGLRDNHGCPFKHMTHDVLRKTLFKCGLVHQDVKSIVQLSKEGSYLQACKNYYEITHNCITEKSFDHPNVYFDYSCTMFENMYLDTED